jgi:hypothetical protein
MSSTGPAGRATYPEALPASPAATAPRLWAGAILLAAALGLVLLGGCFLLGALLLLTGQPGGPVGVPFTGTPEQQTLLTTLYTVAFVCFAGALLLFLLGLRGLLPILKGRRAEALAEKATSP